MVWGAIAVGYKSPLLCFDTTCTQDSYIKMLTENNIIEDLDGQFGSLEYIFQQDNVPPHVAKKTLAWLDEKVLLMENWPPHSPDLSPIETMWVIAKSRLDTSGVTTKQELFSRVRDVWDSIPQSFCDNMVSSFEARSRAVSSLCGDSLNGHWGYVHKLHILLQNTPIEKIDNEILQLELVGRGLRQKIRDRADEELLVFISRCILYFRPMLDINEFTPRLCVIRESLHE